MLYPFGWTECTESAGVIPRVSLFRRIKITPSVTSPANPCWMFPYSHGRACMRSSRGTSGVPDGTVDMGGCCRCRCRCCHCHCRWWLIHLWLTYWLIAAVAVAVAVTVAVAVAHFISEDVDRTAASGIGIGAPSPDDQVSPPGWRVMATVSAPVPS